MDILINGYIEFLYITLALTICTLVIGPIVLLLPVRRRHKVQAKRAMVFMTTTFAYAFVLYLVLYTIYHLCTAHRY